MAGLCRIGNSRRTVIASLVELAGPQRGYIGEFARRVVEHQNEDLTVIAREVPESIKNGALLPGPDAVIAGPGFDEWLSAQSR